MAGGKAVKPSLMARINAHRWQFPLPYVPGRYPEEVFKIKDGMVTGLKTMSKATVAHLNTAIDAIEPSGNSSGKAPSKPSSSRNSGGHSAGKPSDHDGADMSHGEWDESESDDDDDDDESDDSYGSFAESMAISDMPGKPNELDAESDSDESSDAGEPPAGKAPSKAPSKPSASRNSGGHSAGKPPGKSKPSASDNSGQSSDSDKSYVKVERGFLLSGCEKNERDRVNHLRTVRPADSQYAPDELVELAMHHNMITVDKVGKELHIKFASVPKNSAFVLEAQKLRITGEINKGTVKKAFALLIGTTGRYSIEASADKIAIESKSPAGKLIKKIHNESVGL